MQLETFAKQLKFDLGITGGIPRTEEGGFILTLEPNLRVEITSFPEGISFQAVVGQPIQDEGAEEQLTTLMHANLLKQGTGKAILCLSPKGDQVWLKEEIRKELPYPAFRSRLEQFCNFAEYWQTMVA